MAIFDFSDPDWTDKAVKGEHLLITRWLNESVADIRDGTATPEQLATNHKLAAKWNELDAELRRRARQSTRPNSAPGTHKAKRGAHRQREHRIKWHYFPFPTAIWDDPKLSDNAKLAGGKIARSINLGPWNTDLHADLSYAAFGLGRSVFRARQGTADLKEAGYIATESLNRGGVRYWFTDKAMKRDREPTEPK